MSLFGEAEQHLDDGGTHGAEPRAFRHPVGLLVLHILESSETEFDGEVGGRGWLLGGGAGHQGGGGPDYLPGESHDVPPNCCLW